MTGSAQLANGRLDDGRRVDITVQDGRISAIAPAAATAPPGAYDLLGRLVCPGFVDGHIHLDKTFTGTAWRPHVTGDGVMARTAAEKRELAALNLPTAERAAALVRQIVAFGTTRIRCHVDVDPDARLANLHAILAVRQRFAGAIDMQIVAFPQSGIRIAPGTDELLDAAVRDGADLVGGLDPAGIDRDIGAHLDAVFGIAERRGAGIDIHLHDGGTLGAFELRDIAARSRALGMQGRVAVSHAFALGELDEATFAQTADALAEGGVAIMTNGPGRVPMPPVLRLMERGVSVFAGSDNIRDAWSPYGNGDMLERAMLIGYRQGFHTDDALRTAFDMATVGAARVLGGSAGGVAVGEPADLVVLDAAHAPEAVARRPGERTVFKRGILVARDGAFAA